MRNRCAICNVAVPPHEHFLVRMDVFADPTLPAMETDSNEAETSSDAIESLLEQMKSMSADELQDGVHRRFEYIVCASCQKLLLANPLGLPRIRRREGESN